jgi:hypothetical protein
MPTESILGGISKESTQEELLGGVIFLLSEMLEKMPRVDSNDRLLVNPSESTSPVTISSGTVTTVSTVSSVTAITALTNQTNIGGRDASHVTFALSNIGTAHIFNNILVT